MNGPLLAHAQDPPNHRAPSGGSRPKRSLPVGEPVKMPIGDAPAIVVAHPYVWSSGLPTSVTAHLGSGDPLVTSSVTTAFQLAARTPRRDVSVVVHLEGVDRFGDGWAGHRLIQRLVQLGGARVLAWVAPGDHDGRDLALRLGARLLPDTNTVAGGAGDGGAGEPLSEWFRRRHQAPWQDWMLPAAVALASAADRATQADYCKAAWGAAHAAAAHRRLRHLRTILCEETREHPGLERRLAIELLAAAGARGPISHEPIVMRSLHVAARALRAHPPLGLAIGLTRDETCDVLAVADAEITIGRAATSSSGRPQAGAWLLRRSQAIGRVASTRTTTKLAGEAERTRISEHLSRSLLTVHDAIEDGAA